MVHALDWGQYGDLQLGDYVRAQKWIARMEGIAQKVDGQMRVQAALPRVRARFILESQNWQTTPVTEASAPDELYATGMSALQLGDANLARTASRALEVKAKDVAGRGKVHLRQARQLEIMDKQLKGAIQIAAGQNKRGLSLLRETVKITEQLPLPRGAAYPLKPAHEFIGEHLLQNGNAAEAAAAFNESLLRMPNRPRSLLGMARAHLALGDSELAREYYQRVAQIWQSREFPERAEAEAFLAAH